MKLSLRFTNNTVLIINQLLIIALMIDFPAINAPMDNPIFARMFIVKDT